MKKLIFSIVLVTASILALADTNQWTGSLGTNWHTTGNWSLNRVPLATDDVVIPGAPSNKPVISGSDAVCYSLTIQAGATLTIQSSRTLTVNYHWFNEAGASGFMANTSTVVFAGTINQQINNSSGTETFYNLVVNKPAGIIAMTYCNFVIMGDFTLLGGSFSAQTTGKTYTFYGNVTFSGSGLYWPQGTSYFKGATNTSFQNNGYDAYFVDFVLDKTNASNKLTLFADLVCFGADMATIQKGLLDLGGFRFQSNAPVLINNGGKLLMPPGSILNIRNSLQVNSGGEMEVAGNPDNPPLIYKDGNYYVFEVNSGGTIKAEHAIFQNMNADGIQIKSGANVDPEKAFNFCTFELGASGGTLLTINNNQTFTVTEAHFPNNYWGGAYNVRKSVNSGNVTFYATTGAFAGEDYDDDPHNRINWEVGVPTNFEANYQYITWGNSECYNAKQTLTTQNFYVYSGGHVSLIAGHKIILLPDTWVFSEGTLHAWITTDQSYCNNLQSIIAAGEDYETPVEQLSEYNKKGLMLNVYPNPTTGVLTIELNSIDPEVKIEILDLFGRPVFNIISPQATVHHVNLSDNIPGIYLVRLISGDHLLTSKILKI